MQVHQLTTTARRESVRDAGLRALTDASARVDPRRAAPPLACELFRSAGIVPTALTGGGAVPAEAGLSRQSPPRG